MDKTKNYADLKRSSLNLGIDLFGVADITGIKQDFAISPRILSKFDKAIVLGSRLSRILLEDIDAQPTKLYYHHYRAVNSLLDQSALRLTNIIQDKGFDALAIPASQIVDWDAQKAHLSHKRIARLAGLGWIGRNNLLVNKRFGSQLRLVTILTDIPMKTDKPVKDDCGACHMCVKVCPASAIKADPSGFDHAGCFEKLKEFHKLRISEQYVCGVCVKVCPGKTKPIRGGRHG